MRCLVCGAAHANCGGKPPRYVPVGEPNSGQSNPEWRDEPMSLVNLPRIGRRGTVGERFKADRRLYLNAEGLVVEHNDPSKLTLLVAEGGYLSAEDARRYGLAGEEQEEPAGEATTAEEKSTAKSEEKPSRRAEK